MNEKEQMDELEKYLMECGIPYIRKNRLSDGGKEYAKKNPYMPNDWGEQIIVFNNNGKRKWDVIYGFGVYGDPEAPFEGMGDIFLDDVEGYLTAQDIIDRIKEYSAEATNG